MFPSNIRKMNLMKGLMLDHVPPEKFLTFLQSYPAHEQFEYHPLIQDDSYLFYMMRNITHVKKWQKALAGVFPLTEWERLNAEGNNVFLEAIKYKHLKAAKAIAALGANINQTNYLGQNFADILLIHMTQNCHKRKYYSYLLFLNSFLENEYPIALDVKNMDSIRSFVCLSEEIFNNHKKKAIYGYEPYWDDIIEFTQKIGQKLNDSEINAQKRILDESLKNKPKVKRMKI